jgi:carboxypeptidase family protein/PEGA domain-containing protein
MRSECPVLRIVSIALFLLVGGISGFAQNGKLNVHVTPKQAYIFVDDRAVSEASKHPSLSLSAGEHKVELVNYGYKPVTRTVTITAGKTSELEVTLEGIASKVSGPSHVQGTVFLGAPKPLYVPGAKVVLYGDTGISSTITDRDGKFDFFNVEPPGIYFLEATYLGLHAEQNVTVDAGAIVQVSLRLEAPDPNMSAKP